MREAWPLAKVMRHQLEHVAARAAREREELTPEQAAAILAPLRLAIAAALEAEKAVPPRTPKPDVQVEGCAPPEPEPQSLADAWAMYGGIYGQ